MGTCASRNKETGSNFICKSCSIKEGDNGKKPAISCPNGHGVCQLCMSKVGEQLRCPHCSKTIHYVSKEEKNQIQETLVGKKPDLNEDKHKPLQQEQKQPLQHYVLIEQTSPPHKEKGQQQPENKLEANRQEPTLDQTKIQNAFQQPKENNQIESKPVQNPIQPAKTTLDNKAVQKKAEGDKQQEQEGKKEKKVCGCSIANFMVFIVLIVQTLFTAASMLYSVKQPHSQCMDVAHIHPLLAYRPLMQQISGVQTGITIIMSASAFIYKKGCLSESLFDNWMIFLKFILSMKQLLWTAIQTLMQVVIMPIYCSPEIMRFALISSIANVVSFLLVIIKPVYTWVHSKICP